VAPLHPVSLNQILEMPKGNPNPSPATRFSSANPGRAKQKGDRDRLSAAFLKALADDFETNGAAAIETVRKEDPSTYIRVVAALQPKEIELKAPLDGMDDSQLLEAIGALTQALRAQVPDRSEEGTPEKPTLN
jgi:hypothetical protein